MIFCKLIKFLKSIFGSRDDVIFVRPSQPAVDSAMAAELKRLREKKEKIRTLESIARTKKNLESADAIRESLKSDSARSIRGIL